MKSLLSLFNYYFISEILRQKFLIRLLLSKWINLNRNMNEFKYPAIYFAGRKGGMRTCIQVPNAFLYRGKVWFLRVTGITFECSL